jgi:quercetin dioxygenase-like cupin family protein
MKRSELVNLRRYPRAWLATFLALIACAGWYVQGQQPQQPAAGAARTVRTGNTANLDTKDVALVRIKWEPGSRTYWHSHDHASVLLVEEGRGRLQERGKKIVEVAPGQPVYMVGKVEHWHGASPTAGATTLAMYPGGVALNLGKEVTNEEYLGKR